VVIEGLGNRLYSFTVVTVFAEKTSAVEFAEATAAPAIYHTRDAARPGEEIRLYERGASLGNGLIVDPAKGGPRRITTLSPTSDGVDLELRVGNHVGGTRMQIGSPCRDQISGQSCLLQIEHAVPYQQFPTLADWYTPVNWSYEEKIGGSYLWADLPTTAVPGTGLGFGFIARLGSVDNPDARYVRFHVLPDETGAVLRGTAPDRYVVLTISLGYPGVPYA
jgi:hypothetical protein